MGVLPTATQDEIKSKYLQLGKMLLFTKVFLIKLLILFLALRHHPDVSGNPSKSSDKFKEIQEAFSLLSNTESRAQYDLSLRPTSNFYTPSMNANVIARPLTFHMQKDNFEVIRREAGDYWKETRDKYKSEKWLRKPLSEKKVQ